MWAFSCSNDSSFVNSGCSHPEGHHKKYSDSVRVILSHLDSFSILEDTSNVFGGIKKDSTVVGALSRLTDTLISGGLNLIPGVEYLPACLSPVIACSFVLNFAGEGSTGTYGTNKTVSMAFPLAPATVRNSLHQHCRRLHRLNDRALTFFDGGLGDRQTPI